MTFLKTAAIAALAFAAFVPANAAVLTPDSGPEFGTWTRFFFGGVGSPITDSATGDDFWTVTLATAGELHVTDAFVIGDQWELFVDGSSVGVSGAFDLGGPETTDPNIAFGGDVYSWLSYALAPGTYTIAGTTIASPTGSGGAFIRVVSGAVPEPASWALMIAGFGMVGAAVRRRTAATA